MSEFHKSIAVARNRIQSGDFVMTLMKYPIPLQQKYCGQLNTYRRLVEYLLHLLRSYLDVSLVCQFLC
jgi:hypothetical protein